MTTQTQDMKLIEGMKQLRVIEKRMEQNWGRIQEYASIVSNEQPYFASEAEQKKEIIALAQANEDLLVEYLKIKRAVERTNLATVVKFGKLEYTLSDLLVMKRRIGNFIIRTYNALNDQAATTKLMAYQRISTDKQVSVKRLYDETFKYDKLRKWTDLLADVDSRLEVVNATTAIIWE